MTDKQYDDVKRPNHYLSHPSGIECIALTREFNFCLGNAFKYLFRYKLKNGVKDLKKCVWYLIDEYFNGSQSIHNIEEYDQNLFDEFNSYNEGWEHDVFKYIWEGQISCKYVKIRDALNILNIEIKKIEEEEKLHE